MKKAFFIPFALLLFGLNKGLTQPFSVPISNVVDTFWGVPVPDPYRWLESLNSDSTTNWLEQQRKLSKAEKAKFQSKFYGVHSKISFDGGVSMPPIFKSGMYMFKFRIESEDESAVLYYRIKEDGEFVPAYDPNLEHRGKNANIEDYSLSRDGRYLAVSISFGGSDWRTIKVRDLKNVKTLKDQIDWVKFSDVVWADSGFFYTRFSEPPADMIHTAPNTDQRLYFHKIGTPQNSDELIFTKNDRSSNALIFHGTSDGKYLIIYYDVKINGKWNGVIAYKELEKGISSEFQRLLSVGKMEGVKFQVVDHINNRFLVITNFEAPHHRVLSCAPNGQNKLETFIPEYQEELKSVQHIGGKLLCRYFKGGRYSVAIFDLSGKLLKRYIVPDGVYFSSFYGEPTDQVAKFYQKSFYSPPVVCSIDLQNFNMKLDGSTKVTFDPKKYDTVIVTYKSNDGTEVPMYLTHKKNLKKSAKNPVLLYGYGGFGISMAPFYNFENIIFFENNGILAVPMIRGGGEFGDAWHDAGSGLNKQNSFDDFISAAQFLLDSGYTSKERLAIRGGSNGGLLVGAMLTQRPDLYKVAIAEVGVFDMLRYHRFTGNRFIESEYGTVNDSVEFQNLLSYSPYHNLKSGIDYPATLVLTAQNDDRVPPFHSFKFLAALQANSTNKNPHLLHFDDDAGHSGPNTFDRRASESAFILGFMFKQMGLDMHIGF